MVSILSNFLWRLAERTAAQIVSFVVSIILARIIAPSEYGVIAIINILLSFLQVFVDSGLGTSLIQKKEADEADYSTVFIANLFICTVVYILLFLSAPLLERYYGINNISLYFRVSGLTLVVAGFKNILQVYISKQMQFKKFFFATITGTIISAIVGILMALNGLGIWALISQSLVNTTVDTFLLWIVVKWKPKRIFSEKKLRELFSFGWKVLVSSLIVTAYDNIFAIVIGKRYSYEDLAYYDRGKRFPDIIIGNINSSLDSVIFPAMANTNQSVDAILNLTKKSIKISTYIISPMMIGMAAVGDTLVSFLMTDKWLAAVPFLRIICVTYVFYPLLTANQNAIKSLGLGSDFLVMTNKKIMMSLLCLFVAMRYGMMAVALSLVVSTFFSMVITSMPVAKKLHYSLVKQIGDIAHILILSTVMGIVVYCVSFLPFSGSLLLLIQILVGIFIYFMGSKIFKVEEFEYVKNNLADILELGSIGD